MNRKTYQVTTKHPTGYMDGRHELTVNVNDYKNGNGARYVSGAGFGCSRDYLVKTDAEAIRLLLAEHAMTALKIVKCK